MLKFSCKNLQFQKLRTNNTFLLFQDEHQTVGCLVFALGGEYRCFMWLVNFIAPSCPHASKMQPNVARYTSLSSVQFFQSLSCVRLFVTPWTAACQASLFIIKSRSLLKLIHWIGDAIQSTYPLLSPSPPVFNLSQHQGLFQWVSSSHQVAKILEFQLQHQSFQWIFRTGLL